MVKKKLQNQRGELIFGIHPIVELLKAKRRKVIQLYTTKPTPAGWQKIEQVMPSYPIPIQYIDREILHRMVQTTDHQGVVAWVNPFVFRKNIFSDPKKHPVLVLLDGIQDPRNTGAILRSAYCANIDGVVLVQQYAAPLSGVALKASAGLAEYLEIHCASSTAIAIQELKKAQYNILLATFDGENALTVDYQLPVCIVIGSEGSGISKSILSMGKKITLPQRTDDISYNASVAAGIILFLAATKNKKI